MNRRRFLQVLSGGGAACAVGVPLLPALADAPPRSALSMDGAPPRSALSMDGAPLRSALLNEFFLFIHAGGAWDVTVGLDPRNVRSGLVDPATAGPTGTLDANPIRRWKDDTAPQVHPTGLYHGPSFQIVRPPDNASPLVFGPAIGDLLRHHKRLTVINGIAMNTVSHQDGTTFSATGRHLAGTKAVACSIDTMLADAGGAEQLLPVVSINYPSSYIGSNLDRRVVPLAISGIGSLAASLRRSAVYDAPEQRDGVTALLSQEAQDLMGLSAEPDVMRGMYLQYQSLRRMNRESLLDVFTQRYLQERYPRFAWGGMPASVNAAFAVEAMRRNLVRCVGFAYGGFDTHFGNYKQQALLQQNLFDMLAVVLDYLDETPHPSLSGARLAEHTHIMVLSDFCRTPMINLNLGRDHYPNNSSLIISPRFRGDFVFGRSDPDQLLPLNAKVFSDGERPISPPDILRTFVSAFGGDPGKYLRDGDVVPELLATWVKHTPAN